MLTGWKTVVVNLAIVVFGALVAFDWASISPAYAGIIVAAIGAINVWLRTQTNTPVGSSEKTNDAKIEKGL